MQRLDYAAAQPQIVGELTKVTNSLHRGGLDRKLKILVDLRASQINGCAFCIDMHSKQAKLAGERELRLYALPAWRESPLFSDRERAALAWTEAVTRLGEQGVCDEDWNAVRAQFNDAEIAELTLAIALINAWNRLGVSFRTTPGSLDKPFGLDKAGLS
jgi:AhpD family alkylhydroperoxidase